MSETNGSDRTAKVSVEVTSSSGTTTFENIKEYSYDSDILTFGDPFAVSISNPDGIHSKKISRGDSITLSIADPDVNGGQNIKKITGIVTNLAYTGDPRGGDLITITGADIGWHLTNNCVPLFTRYRGYTLQRLLNAVILDPKWGFKGTRSGNYNVKLRLGRAGIVPPTVANQLPPLIQFEPGQTIADILVPILRRMKLLLNVSSDGYLQFFKPQADTNVYFSFHNHASTEKNRNLNNVSRYQLADSIDGVYTKVTCVGQTNEIGNPATVEDPNKAFRRGDYANTGSLPFTRYITFSDGEQFKKSDAALRAQWKWQRGQFDSWVLNYIVKGHSQVRNGVGTPYEADLLCEINDSVLGLNDTYYISAVRYVRTMSEGTQTYLTIRKKNFLGA